LVITQTASQFSICAYNQIKQETPTPQIFVFTLTVQKKITKQRSQYIFPSKLYSHKLPHNTSVYTAEFYRNKQRCPPHCSQWSEWTNQQTRRIAIFHGGCKFK